MPRVEIENGQVVAKWPDGRVEVIRARVISKVKSRQMKWKEGSFLDKQQVKDEKYQIGQRIA